MLGPVVVAAMMTNKLQQEAFVRSQVITTSFGEASTRQMIEEGIPHVRMLFDVEFARVDEPS